jgi:hypothetical protein
MPRLLCVLAMLAASAGTPDAKTDIQDLSPLLAKSVRRTRQGTSGGSSNF